MPKRFAFGDVLIILLFIAGAVYLFKYFSQPQGSDVEISVNNVPYGKWPLTAVPETISVNSCMKVEIKKQGVRILSSNCPKQICSHSQPINKTGQSIICVPNRVVIQITGGKLETDAIAQ